MRTSLWACALLLFAHDAFAERVRVGSFALDVDTREACVLVPDGHRNDAACAGVDASSMLDVHGKPMSYAFLAVMPARTRGYWLALVPFGTPPRGIEETKRGLRQYLVDDGRWEVQGPGSTSTTTIGGELACTTFDFDVTSKGETYAVSYLVFPPAKGYIVETLADKADAREASEQARRVLGTWSAQRAANDSSLADALWVAHRAWLLLAFVAVLVLVVYDARGRRTKKPRRNTLAIDLAKYSSARPLGAAAAVMTCGSVLLEVFAYTFPSLGLLFRALAALVAYAVFAPLLSWVHRIAVNARVLGCADVPTATKAVTWFFVPFASVFMPYRSVADVAASMRGPGRMDAVWRVALWWLPMVAMLAARVFDWSVARTLFAAITSLAMWSMVIAIDQGQARMFRKAKQRQRHDESLHDASPRGDDRRRSNPCASDWA